MAVGSLRPGRPAPLRRLRPARPRPTPGAGGIPLPAVGPESRALLRCPRVEPRALPPGRARDPPPALCPRPHRVPGAPRLRPLAAVVAAGWPGQLAGRGRVDDGRGPPRPPP